MDENPPKEFYVDPDDDEIMFKLGDQQKKDLFLLRQKSASGLDVPVEEHRGWRVENTPRLRDITQNINNWPTPPNLRKVPYLQKRKSKPPPVEEKISFEEAAEATENDIKGNDSLSKTYSIEEAEEPDEVIGEKNEAPYDVQEAVGKDEKNIQDTIRQDDMETINDQENIRPKDSGDIRQHQMEIMRHKDQENIRPKDSDDFRQYEMEIMHHKDQENIRPKDSECILQDEMAIVRHKDQENIRQDVMEAIRQDQENIHHKDLEENQENMHPNEKSIRQTHSELSFITSYINTDSIREVEETFESVSGAGEDLFALSPNHISKTKDFDSGAIPPEESHKSQAGGDEHCNEISASAEPLLSGIIDFKKPESLKTVETEKPQVLSSENPNEVPIQKIQENKLEESYPENQKNEVHETSETTVFETPFETEPIEACDVESIEENKLEEPYQENQKNEAHETSETAVFETHNETEASNPLPDPSNHTGINHTANYVNPNETEASELNYSESLYDRSFDTFGISRSKFEDSETSLDGYFDEKVEQSAALDVSTSWIFDDVHSQLTATLDSSEDDEAQEVTLPTFHVSSTPRHDKKNTSPFFKTPARPGDYNLSILSEAAAALDKVLQRSQLPAIIITDFDQDKAAPACLLPDKKAPDVVKSNKTPPAKTVREKALLRSVKKSGPPTTNVRGTFSSAKKSDSIKRTIFAPLSEKKPTKKGIISDLPLGSKSAKKAIFGEGSGKVSKALSSPLKKSSPEVGSIKTVPADAPKECAVVSNADTNGELEILSSPQKQTANEMPAPKAKNPDKNEISQKNSSNDVVAPSSKIQGEVLSKTENACTPEKAHAALQKVSESPSKKSTQEDVPKEPESDRTQKVLPRPRVDPSLTKVLPGSIKKVPSARKVPILSAKKPVSILPLSARKQAIPKLVAHSAKAEDKGSGSSGSYKSCSSSIKKTAGTSSIPQFSAAKPVCSTPMGADIPKRSEHSSRIPLSKPIGKPKAAAKTLQFP